MQTTENNSWRSELKKTLSAKERMAIMRVKMPELAPEIRRSNYEEVNRGLTLEMAVNEAKRCLDCPKPSCVEGCPVGIDIPSFIKNIERGQIVEAANVLKEYSALPAVCGRVCPQEKQCESRCIHRKTGKEAVAIGYLERFAADFAISNPTPTPPKEEGARAFQIQTNFEMPHTPPHLEGAGGRYKIAVAGSGPAGLSFAGEMAKFGCDVTVFEALHEIGGVLKYGIPEFRLPNKIIDAEIENLQLSGVKFVTNCIIGKTLTIDDLKNDGFRAVFVASGAGLPNFMHIKGENLIGVMSSNEYLTRINLMGAARETDSATPVFQGKTVAVIGGGNTAMDSVRTALRVGAERAILVYRRSEEEMPARIEEIKHAKEEGVEFLTLNNPIEYIGNKNGRVEKMILQKMVLGEEDEKGRRSPIATSETQTIDVDVVIVSVGVSPNPLIPSSIRGLEVTRKNTIVVDENTLQSSIPTIFAGGDIVRGGATVILAMGDGKRAAQNMNEKILKEEI
jgi:glutamate synthase (NADPH/NADH) small chain